MSLIVGENRKLLVFPIGQLPEMGRGKGVRLQRYKDGGLSDAKMFKLDDGLTWLDTSGRTWTVGAGRSAGVARQPGRSRSPAAEGLPQEQPFGG